MRFVPVLWPAMLYLDRHRPVDLRHSMLLLYLPCASGQHQHSRSKRWKRDGHHSGPISFFVGIVVSVGHSHWLVAGAVVDLLDGHADVEHSCDEEVVGVAV